ncbi:MAG: 4Fe-4S dicluster domain-containing protein [Oscillospiraceae bacterium]
MSFQFPFLKEALSQLFSKPSTERYPFVKKEAPEGYRGKLAFHPEKCINCGLCIRVCSPAAITKSIEKTEEGDRITMSFDLTSCTFCQMCADFCSKSAIEMTREYSMVAEDAKDLIVTGTFIKTPPVKKAPPAPKPVPAEAPAPVDSKMEEPKCDADQ